MVGESHSSDVEMKSVGEKKITKPKGQVSFANVIQHRAIPATDSSQAIPVPISIAKRSMSPPLSSSLPDHKMAERKNPDWVEVKKTKKSAKKKPTQVGVLFCIGVLFLC